MPIFEWKDDYIVNVNLIDIQHKRLFEILNEFYDDIMAIKGQEVIKDVIKNLAEYATIHFKTEEDLMIKYNYPEYQSHKNEHKIFVDKVLELMKKLESDTFIPSIEVLNFLIDWLKNHILTIDKRYSKFFNEHGVK